MGTRMNLLFLDEDDRVIVNLYSNSSHSLIDAHELVSRLALESIGPNDLLHRLLKVQYSSQIGNNFAGDQVFSLDVAMGDFEYILIVRPDLTIQKFNAGDESLACLLNCSCARAVANARA